MYVFFNDPGHGWLRVELAELKALGILDKISGYSYINGKFAYLEEDCDAALFAKAKNTSLKRLEEIGQLKENYDRNNSTIRHFARYSKELAEAILK